MMVLLYFAGFAVILFLVLRLTCGAFVMGREGTEGVARLPLVPLGWALSLFLALTFAICVLFDLLFPSMAMYQTWLKLLPGFTWISLPSFLLGLAEAFAYGWYVALIFAPLFNLFSSRWAK